MLKAITATALVHDERIPVGDIIEFLGTLWGVSDIRSVFEEAYSRYHSSIAVIEAKERGFIDVHVRDFELEQELPGYVIGMYHLLA